MGKVGRFACIFVPMGLTIASLICLLLVFLGGQNKGSELLRELRFMRVDASNFTSEPNYSVIGGTDIDDQLFDSFVGSANAGNLKDIYDIYLWNYCSGDVNNVDQETITYCSSRKANFYFNPIEVWQLNGTSIQEHFPTEVDKALNVYSKVARWMFAVYAIAFFTTLAEIVVGIFAICSRWGSFVTTIVSSVSSVFTLAAAITSTALFGTLTGAFNTFLHPYQIRASLSTRMLAVVWLAVAFSLGAGFFWLISTCCCSGKSDGKRKTYAEKTPYTYERVASPYMGGSSSGHGQSVPLQNMGHNAGYSKQGAAYEPFRHN